LPRRELLKANKAHANMVTRSLKKLSIFFIVTLAGTNFYYLFGNSRKNSNFVLNGNSGKNSNLVLNKKKQQLFSNSTQIQKPAVVDQAPVLNKKKPQLFSNSTQIQKSAVVDQAPVLKKKKQVFRSSEQILQKYALLEEQAQELKKKKQAQQIQKYALLAEKAQELKKKKQVFRTNSQQIQKPAVVVLTTNLKDAKCAVFKCTNNVAKCDNILPTNYDDGTEPPCCVHVLRDMARVFDDEMSRLGLDYTATFGTLLGYRRSDRLIPWTGDNDYIIPSKNVVNAMVERWDTKSTGLAHLMQGINRICATPDFAGGKLQKWTTHFHPFLSTQLCFTGLPYIDLYVGRNTSSTMFQELVGCKHLYRDVFPSKRVLVYNKTFAQNFPANPDQLLRSFYGLNWRTPIDNDPHGKAKYCSYSPFLK